MDKIPDSSISGVSSTGEFVFMKRLGFVDADVEVGECSGSTFIRFSAGSIAVSSGFTGAGRFRPDMLVF